MENINMETGQFLSFVLAGEVYALDIGKVREVLEMQSITRVPRMPPYMRGIINLRGNAVPVVDLKGKFGLGRTERTVDTCIVIVEVAVAGEVLVIGSLTDSVREVFELTANRVMEAPNMGVGIDTAFLKGVGKLEGQFVMILDVERVFSGEELSSLSSLHGEEEPAEAARRPVGSPFVGAGFGPCSPTNDSNKNP